MVDYESFKNSITIHNEKQKQLMFNECLKFISDIETAKLFRSLAQCAVSFKC